MRRILPAILITFLSILCVQPLQLSAQSVVIELAQSLVYEGDFNGAITLLQQAKLQYPESEQVLLYEAHLLAWSGAYDQSIISFRQFLSENPDHLEALTEFGYALSWSGNFPNALFTFRDALKLDPQHLDARKGLAHSYLSRGNLIGAKYEFTALAEDYPGIPEFRIGLARTEFALGYRQQAVVILKQLTREQPDLAEVEELLHKYKVQEGGIEVGFLTSWSLQDSLSKFGFRQFNLSYFLNTETVLYTNLDNALSLDNIDFLATGQSALAVSLGVFHNWNDRLASRIEIGQRFNPVWPNDQFLIKTEKVVFTEAGFHWKAGEFLGPTVWGLKRVT